MATIIFARDLYYYCTLWTRKMRTFARCPFLRLTRRAQSTTLPQKADLSLPELITARVDDSSELVHLGWSDGEWRTLHPRWLRDNCPSRRHPQTGQRICSSTDLPGRLAVSRCSAAAPSLLRVTWKPDGHESEYCGHWLRAVAPHHFADINLRSAAGESDKREPNAAPSSIPVFHYEEACCNGERGVWEWMRAIRTYGATLLHDVPQAESTVRKVAELLGPVQTHIYGDVFDVRKQNPSTAAHKSPNE